MGLREYYRKRDFKKTPEPAGKEHAHKKKELMFVIQKHAASHLHYDFRLEMEGVLRSWAVPKGPPTELGEKRLAMQVEDHPIEYGDFEGIIPPGEYGGGTVMLWDTGTYSVDDNDPVAAWRRGRINLTMKGKKLKGTWALVRTAPSSDGRAKWLLMKTGKPMRAISARRDDTSVLTRRSMKRIAAEKSATWHSNRSSKSEKPARKPRTRMSGKSRMVPGFVEPMKARLVESVPSEGDWVFEIKFDGFRSLGVKDGKEIKLFSRNEIDQNERFPSIADALHDLPCKSCIIDGEIVAVDSKGRPSFQLLQHQMSDERNGKKAHLRYYVFDILMLDGEDLTQLPLEERKARLEALLAEVGDPVFFSASLEGKPEKLLAMARKQGLEGLIGKERTSTYEIGKRANTWIKLKVVNEQEFVIGGFTPPKGTRKHLGALIIGYYDDGEFRFASKVGTGFSQELLKELQRKLTRIRVEDCPFVDLPSPSSDPNGIGPGEFATCTWVEPEMVAQIRFTEWTRDDHLRHPVFIGLRDDKPAGKVIRERREKVK